MKYYYTLLGSCICAFLLCIASVNAQSANLLKEGSQTPFGNLDKTPMLGNIVYGRQPDESTIPMLKEQGFNLILSVRYDDEPADYDARKVIEKNGMSFVQISYLKGSINDKVRHVDDEAVTQIKQVIEGAIDNGGKVLLHCQSGQRAAAALGSILYRDYGFSKEEAKKYALKAGLTSKNTGAIYDRYIDSIER
ncbi:MAG: hypothetical protein HOH19_03295 [Kordiimonadaceae bacterium]|nr:hypothetical protein [Kordiimonadaceae bacterium]MBT6031576.1 hypothetical protein [Kordiimonadaceae bacterium]